MFSGAKGGSLKFGSTTMDYITFGRGKKVLVLIPGLSDGLKTVKGTQKAMALMYRRYARDFRVYVFSRKNDLQQGYSTEDMAREVKEAMDRLGITSAYVKGLSQGGMIAQHLAINEPRVVEKLVIAVSLARPNETIRRVVAHWLDLAKAGDYKNLVIDSMEKNYTEAYIKKKKYRLLYPLITRIGKPKDFSRFIVQGEACMSHNAYDKLERIQCPALVIGGGQDQVVGANTSGEMAEKIPRCRLVLFPGLGHGAYAETKEFDREVLRFLKEDPG